jgi:hypothetical protein
VRALPSQRPSSWSSIAVVVITLFVPPVGLALGAVWLVRAIRNPAEPRELRVRWGWITGFAAVWTILWLALITHR